jgi:hypothetical protein
LDDVKAHLNQALTVDDALIEGKIVAAQRHIEDMLGYDLPTEYPTAGDITYPATVPDPLKEAIRELAAWWYSQREAAIVGSGTTATAVPMGVEDIIANYRNYSWGDDEDEDE